MVQKNNSKQSSAAKMSPIVRSLVEKYLISMHNISYDLGEESEIRNEIVVWIKAISLASIRTHLKSKRIRH